VVLLEVIAAIHASLYFAFLPYPYLFYPTEESATLAPQRRLQYHRPELQPSPYLVLLMHRLVPNEL